MSLEERGSTRTNIDTKNRERDDLQEALQRADQKVDKIVYRLKGLGKESAAKRFLEIKNYHLGSLPEDALVDLEEMVRLMEPTVRHFEKTRQTAQKSLRTAHEDHSESPRSQE